ncbi:MAG: LCP family protein [Rubrobacter sp.]|nr:LCP family protein [Rubrobacteraceae bacterium]MBA3794016.1 LCP family protein [Rubrobacter sp.]MDQ3316526.1 LCP family protein [Actinomycetota bacterium]
MRDFQDYTKEPGTTRRRWWVWSLPVFVVALAVGAVAFAYEPDGGNPQGPERLEASPTSWIQRMFGGGGQLAEGPFNVLVLGVDERPESEEDGSRTDTIMLVRVMPESGDVKLLSVPRDLLVEVEPGVEDRINAAYNFGGIEQTITAFEEYSGVPVDHYAIVDFEGFEETVDAMGGVRVDVGSGQFPEKWRMGEGVQRLNGRKALMYARYRGTPGGDLDRIQHQQELVRAMRSQALDWNIVRRLPEILKVANRNVQTDVGFADGVSLGRILIRRGPNAPMTSEQLQGDPETLENGNQVLLPDDEANEPILNQFRY